jgi:NADH-quinone oxidoreductase subunit N
MFQEAIISLSKFYPELALGGTIVAIIIVELFFKRRTQVSGIIAIAGLIVTLALVVQQLYFQPQAVFYQMIVLDPFAYFFKFLLIASAFLIVIFSFISREINPRQEKTGHRPDSTGLDEMEGGHRLVSTGLDEMKGGRRPVSTGRLQEYYALIIALTLGGFLMASSVNLLMMYLSLELVSISSYILAGYIKQTKRSTEAALKYVIYGGVSSGIMLYGISLLYGITGTTDIFAISNFLASNPINLVTLLISVFLILAGFGYKISAVPFHFWAPDVYEGAPLPITALLSVSSKAAGFAMMIRFFLVSFRMPEHFGISGLSMLPSLHWEEIIAVISVATMTLGNFVAIWQDNIKRLLAFSSIAQAGYMLLGVVVINQPNSGGLAATIIYLSVYLVMNLGAFLCAILISNKFKTESIEEMKGFGYRAPFLCVAFGIFLFSLTGVPATAGFIGKFYIFSALIKSGFVWLAIIGLLNAVVSLYYYVKILKNMFLLRPAMPDGRQAGSESGVRMAFGDSVMLLILIIPTILFGIYFAPLTKFAEYSVHIFGIP